MREIVGWISANPMQAAYGAVLLTLLLLLYKIVRDPNYKNFRCVYMVSNSGGFPDNDKLWMWGAFITSTYGFLHLLWDQRLTEFYFIGYMTVWAASKAYALKKRVEVETEPPSQMTSTSETKTTTTKKETK